MKITRAVKVRAYPNKTQQNMIRNTIDCCRFVYNHMLSRNIKVYARRKEHLNYNQIQNLLPIMKRYMPWLIEADSQALKYACRQVDTAFQKFFKHGAGFPKFHKKRGRQSYTTTQGKSIHIKGSKIKLPLLGLVKVRGLQNLPDNTKICRATISLEPDETFYISVTYTYEHNILPQEVHEDNILGLDYKSNGFYVDSNGDIADMPHYFRESQAKLAKAQRQLSKKQGSRKGEKKSSGWKKQHRKVAKLQKHIANQRNDILHKLSRELADGYDAIGVEDLNMRALSNKSFGNGKATMDNGFGEFRRMLDYKLQDRGKPPLIKVDKFYPSSQICSCCGHQNPELKDLSIREWICPNCGMEHDRDHNAAKNIKAETIRILLKQNAA